MEVRELAYQQRVLRLLDDYLDELVAQKTKADKLEQVLRQTSPDDPDATCFLKVPALDFPQQAWQALAQQSKLPQSRVGIPHSPRPDGIGCPVPNIVYKIPTAGGKTYLAVSSLAKICHKYLRQSTGFVLWVVPNEAIYAQTKKQLNDRSHPYRQLLDNLSGNTVKLMEKHTPLNANDVESHLCVMLLMLQSANRQTKDTLKMFQDRGDVQGFSPEEGNQQAHRDALKAIPNLDTYNLADSAYPWMPVKDSLGNALRSIRPIVVMDEGHKAVSDLAFETLYGFNPCFVLELTATPKDVKGNKRQKARTQNILAEVVGVELDREGMIKMPLNLDSRQSSDWRSTLSAALDRLNGLQQQAKRYHANRNRYIRPIMLVQVERTGKEQRDGKHIHADDVQSWLTTTGGLDIAEVAIKTSIRNDLKEPENQDLLSDANRIRVIITKSALQEGWDCPFAYVLCSLAASSNQSAMTQLVGRILRQPYAQKTEVGMLDEGYVITHHTETNSVVAAIKEGLERDGMGDLAQSISVESAGAVQANRSIIRRNQKFANTEIFLPKVLRVLGEDKAELDYEADILCALDWQDLDVTEFTQSVSEDAPIVERQLRRIWLEDEQGVRKAESTYIGTPLDNRQFDCVYATQFISDIIPNPWLARETVGRVLAGLHSKKMSADQIGKMSALINEELRKWLLKQRDSKAETYFRKEVDAGRIQFRLRSDGRLNFVNWKMPDKTQTGQTSGSSQLLSGTGSALERSLFSPMYAGDMNTSEQEVAVYLDGQQAVQWWHRNVARNHYFLQGWRRDKIYPDFICSVQASKAGNAKICVLEMKGEHLEGNTDTTYKQAMMQLLTNSFDMEQAQRVGEVSLQLDDTISVQCDLVMFAQWKTKLPPILVGNNSS
ncbi:MAG: DEAD/DEAH box helicase [Gammaproteobacteria bacterium]